MNDVLRERLIRKLDTLPEERVYQIFDYIDFLESKYAQRSSQAGNPLTRFAEGMEDTLRAGRMSANVIGGTMNIMNKAVGAISEVAAAGKSVATGIMDVATGGGAAPKTPEANPPEIPRAGPHELGSQLPKPPGDERK
ncbi:MAG TPA: DUF2281 domain-containing protein [Gemmatimonadaceae bacterium]|jgi:hypothetical protein